MTRPVVTSRQALVIWTVLLAISFRREDLALAIGANLLTMELVAHTGRAVNLIAQAAALLVPRDSRARWLEEWRADGQALVADERHLVAIVWSLGYLGAALRIRLRWLLEEQNNAKASVSLRLLLVSVGGCCWSAIGSRSLVSPSGAAIALAACALLWLAGLWIAQAPTAPAGFGAGAILSFALTTVVLASGTTGPSAVNTITLGILTALGLVMVFRHPGDILAALRTLLEDEDPDDPEDPEIPELPKVPEGS